MARASTPNEPLPAEPRPVTTNEGDPGPDPAWYDRMFGGAAPGPLRVTVQSGPLHGASPMRLDVPMEVSKVEGAALWLVDKRDPIAGGSTRMGNVPIDITEDAFVRRFYGAMPQSSDDAVAVFTLRPADAAGKRLGVFSTENPHTLVRYAYESPILADIRAKLAEESKLTDPNVGGPTVMTLMQEMMRRAEADARRAREEAVEAKRLADEERRALAEQKMLHSQGMAGDATKFVTDLGAESRRMYGDVITQQAEARRLEKEAEREARKAEREEEVAKRNAEIARIQAESTERLALAKLEAEVKMKEAEARAAADRAAIEAEKTRIREERLERETQAREDRLEREARESREREAKEKRDADERAERAAREERALKMANEHNLALAKIAQDAREAEARRDADERERNKQHLDFMLGMIKSQSSATASPFGLAGQVLQELGFTGPTLIEKAKELFGKGEGDGQSIGVVIAEGLFGLGKELIKRLPEGDDIEEDEEEEEEDDEAGEVVQQPPAARRKVTQGQVPVVQKVLGSETTPAAGTTTPETPAAPSVDIAGDRAAREALETFVAAIEGKPAEEWPTIIAEHAANGALLAYLKRDFTSAFEGFDVDVPALLAAFTALGLV